MDKNIKERLLSDENIFLSIYLLESYVQNKGLLSDADQKKMHELKDVFNSGIITDMIKEVKKTLRQIMKDEDIYFNTSVYFKPKSYDNEIAFRPLHTASLVEQIAMIAMLQILVYDIGNEDQLIPSEISKLIPSNFFGNRISFNGRQLFKPWGDQYQEYTSKANDMLYTYSETLEYKYEVNLDLKDFYPSINPQVLYNYMSGKIPLKLDSSDVKTMKTIIRKLLYFNLNITNNEEMKWYLRLELDSPLDEADMKERCKYVKGIPQGLPHSCFFANVFMLIVKKQYSTYLSGESLFYVDDSIIFTNGKEGELSKEFINIIDNINAAIKQQEQELLAEDKNKKITPSDYGYGAKEFGVRVHNPKDSKNSKSTFIEINNDKENSGAQYLQGISRETSKIGFDIYSTFSEEADEMLKSRAEAILETIEKEIKTIDKKNNKPYLEKLIRYRKFFKYRFTILDYKTTGSIHDLKEKVIEDITIREDKKNDDLREFFAKYTDDIIAATINFVFNKCIDEGIDTKDLINAVCKLDESIYGDVYKDKGRYSYIYKVNYKYLELEKRNLYYEIDTYKSLKRQVEIKYRYLRQKPNAIRYKKLEDSLNSFYDKDNYIKLYKELNITEFFNNSKYVRKTSNEFERMILNSLFSYVFNYEIDDSYNFAKKSRLPIEYSEIRILSILRNNDFNFEEFFKRYFQLINKEFRQTADYSLFQVLDIFRVFVSESKEIDNLILIHKYCCETWKNGSKYLHFYTLHNQEHAVSMIKSSIQLLHGISYLQLKKTDYYILFLTCYLHDIAMVTTPDISKFYKDNNETSNVIYTDFIEELELENSIGTKIKLSNAYQEIDEFFESEIRSHHAKNSATEIRKHKELNFIEPTIREIVAEVTAAHGYSTADIYILKSKGSTSLINEKFIKIILRLSDLLDMSRYRISEIILNHNLKNLNSTSRFHWISHLITDGYKLNTEYSVKERENQKSNENSSYLKKGNITEKLILTIEVLMSQTTEVVNNNKCKNVSNSNLEMNKDGTGNIKMSFNKDESCSNEKCNFLCRWFTEKNEYLLDELASLENYLNSISDNLFFSKIEIEIKVVENTEIANDTFDYLREYLE